MRIIDAHTHAYEPQEMEVLQERLTLLDSSMDSASPHKWQVHGNGGLDRLIQMEKQAEVEAMVLLPVPSRPERVGELNRWAARAAREHSQIISFGSLHPHGDQQADLAELMELGLKGVKLHPMVQNFDLDEPEAQDLLDLIAESGLPVLTDTMNLKGLYSAKPHLQPVFEMFQIMSCVPEQIARAARKRPNLKIIAAHGGCLYGWENLEPLMGLDNVYMDLAYMNGLIDSKQVCRIIRQKGPERFLYGSDAPWRTPLEHRKWFEGLGLSPMEKEALAWGTASELLGL